MQAQSQQPRTPACSRDRIPAMLTPLLTALVALAGATAVATIIIDNPDPSILYSGPWVNDPIADPQRLNYDATLAYTNKSGAQATLIFSGGEC